MLTRWQGFSDQKAESSEHQELIIPPFMCLC